MSKNAKKTRKSQKGKWGHIGAPPKYVRWPVGSFTMEKLFKLNSKGKNKQCELSLRNKVDDGLEDGTILELKAKKQPHGAVGRPKSVFVLKTKYVASKMELADKTAKAPKARKVKTTPVAAPVPAAAPAAAEPVTAQPAPAASAPAPAPAVETAPPAPVETSPATSAPAPAPVVG